jgi:retinol dehydrogenase-12
MYDRYISRGSFFTSHFHICPSNRLLTQSSTTMLFIEFLSAQLFITPQVPTTSLGGQTVVITGANRGLGFEAAKHVARLGASKLILAVRSVSNGEAAKASILKGNPTKKLDIEVWPLDLTNYDSVKAFVIRAETLPRIDAILNNAGISTAVFTLAEDNESTITINVISTFLLSILLLPKLRSTAEKFFTTPRITIVGSEVHNWVAFKERNVPDGEVLAGLNDRSKANMKERYFLSKLLVMFGVRELAALIDASSKKSGVASVVLNCPAPGFVATELDHENANSVIFKIMNKVLARNVEVGSRPLVDGMVRGKESHGQYLSESKVKK